MEATTSEELTPSEIVARLDTQIIGQADAKRLVAIAYRNRWRRQHVADEQLRHEITPKNILMVGPTGVGKTEIARRLAKLANAPFVKVEATRFTEVGYVGRDVETIVRDLVDVAYALAEETATAAFRPQAQRSARDKVVAALGPLDEAERTKYELRVDAGEMDDHEVEVAIQPQGARIDLNMAAPGAMPQQMEELTRGLQDMFSKVQQGRQPRKQRVTVKRALELLEREEVQRFLDQEQLKSTALQLAQQNGIVFIDEFDKIAGSGGTDRLDISRQGVQRDLLPLIEGTTVQTKYGPVETDHILFVASGAFHYAKPSDLIPELQGRLPVRVNLKSLTVEDFVKILSETKHCLIKQYEALLATEGVTVTFEATSIKRIAELASKINEQQENIGARRLHTLMERLVEKISFKASEMEGSTHSFSPAEVDATIGELSKDESAARIFL